MSRIGGVYGNTKQGLQASWGSGESSMQLCNVFKILCIHQSTAYFVFLL